MKPTTKLAITIGMALFFSIYSIVQASLFFKINFEDSVDPSIINGLLTATAILFGFISLEARDIKPFPARFFYVSILIIFLMITGLVYFSEVIVTGHATKLVFVIAFSNFIFCVLCSVNTILARYFMSGEDAQKS
jgi:hypothetical protein